MASALTAILGEITLFEANKKQLFRIGNEQFACMFLSHVSYTIYYALKKGIVI